jgi:hypothetical protein
MRGVPILVIQQGKEVKYRSLFLQFIGAMSIYFMAFPYFLLDLAILQYQAIYFEITGIPKLKRSDYVIFDRAKLSKLNFGQKVNCVYCEYVNGMSAYAKAIANQTEIYSCAIKHHTMAEGQEHQKEFFDYADYK